MSDKVFVSDVYTLFRTVISSSLFTVITPSCVSESSVVLSGIASVLYEQIEFTIDRINAVTSQNDLLNSLWNKLKYGYYTQNGEFTVINKNIFAS